MMKKITFSITVILLAVITMTFIADAQEQEKEGTLRYARGTREIESKILVHAERYLKGILKLEITEELLGGFEPDYVEYFLDGELVAIVSEPPFSASIDAGSFTKKRNVLIIATREKKIELKSVATDVTGQARPVDAVEGGFKIAILSPIDGNYVVGRTPILVEAEFKDSAVMESVQIYVDGVLVSTLTGEPWEYVHNFGRSFNGRRVSAVAFDSYGRRAEAAVMTAPLERSTLFIETRVVTLDVTVTDDRGKFIGGLSQDDFEIFDNGQLQEVRYFSTEERPIWVAVLIDTSGSMQGGKIRRSVFAAQQFVSQLKPQDHAMVLTFGPGVKTVSEFTSDFVGLIDEIGKIDAIRNAQTPLNQSLYNAMEAFKDRVGRRAIIVISDGADTASAVTPDVVHEAAKTSDVRIYAIAIRQLGIAGGGFAADDEAAYLMRGLADVTGGESYFPVSSSEFLKIFQTIAEELRSQYSIGYIPPRVEDNTWRSIEVKVKKGGIARTKQGYYPWEQ